VFASVGILFNHESPLRSSQFISQKIVQAAVDIKNGGSDKLILGSLESKIDWGFAADYVEAMHLILQQPNPEDFVIASGELHSVKDFVKEAFEYLDLDWKDYVEENPQLITKAKTNPLCGNPSKLKRKTGWQPTLSFDKLIQLMIRQAQEKYALR